MSYRGRVQLWVLESVDSFAGVGATEVLVINPEIVLCRLFAVNDDHPTADLCCRLAVLFKSWFFQ